MASNMDSDDSKGERSRQPMSRRPDMPVLYTTGTFYQVGFDVGRTFADRIKGHWSQSQVIQEILIPYVDTPEGKDYYNSTLEACRIAFPQYIREVEGMAEGSGFPFKNVFMLCILKEVCNVLSPAMRQNETSNGCTDVLVNQPYCKILAHNEDAHYIMDSYGYLVSARIVENGEEVESFTSYCYPGTLPGCAFSFNRHGMVFGCDGLYPSYVVKNAPTRIFVNRAVIKAKTVDEAIQILKNSGHGVAYGFTINIADVKNPANMWSIEVGPQTGESITHIHTLWEEADPSKLCHYTHVNSIEHLKGVAEIPDLVSSTARRERARQMDPPRTREGVLALLGDTENKQNPLFRTPQSKYDGQTLFTAVVDVLENRMDFYRDNPADPRVHPLFSMQVKDGNN